MLRPGIAFEQTFSVTKDLTARVVGSGTLDVLATPVMIARMEEAAWRAVAPELPEDSGTVGTHMDVKHVSPTPVGMTVTCACELTEIDGRRLVFRITMSDEAGEVGHGTHERFLVGKERFMEKAEKKRAQIGK